MLIQSNNPNNPSKFLGNWIVRTIIILLFLFTGLFPHEVWRVYEPFSISLTKSILNGGDLVVGSIGGLKFTERPQLYELLSAALVYIFGNQLEFHNIARFINPFILMGTLVSISFASKNFNGRAQHSIYYRSEVSEDDVVFWSAPFLLLGSVGFVVPSHELSPFVLVVFSWSLMFLGLSNEGLRRFIQVFLGLTILFWSERIGFWLFGTFFLSLSVFFERKSYLWTLLAILLSTVYPLVWYKIVFDIPEHSLLFEIGDGEGTHSKLLNFWEYSRLLSWFIFPSSVLLLASFWRKSWHLKIVVLLMVSFLIFHSFLPYSQLRASPLLMLVVFAALEVPHLSRSQLSFSQIFGLSCFALMFIFIFLSIYNLSFFDLYPNLKPTPLDPLSVLIAFLLIFLAFLGFNLRVNSSIVPFSNWLIYVVSIWIIVMVIFLPWIDNNKSHRSLVLSSLPFFRGGCVYVSDFSTASFWNYYAGVNFSDISKDCNYALLKIKGEIKVPGKVLWESSRTGSKESYYLVQLGD